MSHVHFVSTEAYRDRVIQLGESPDRVFVSGAPALDNLRTFAPLTKAALEARFGFDLSEAPLVVTFHPSTLELDATEKDVVELLEAIAASGQPAVFTAPNADPSGRIIRARIERFCDAASKAWFVENLGVESYYSLLTHARAMVGNSSSGIIETASFGLPTVNVGNRQKGRLASGNVLHAPAERAAIRQALARACDPEFRQSLKEARNIYGDGRAAARIVETIRSLPPAAALCTKQFFDLPPHRVH